MLPDPRTIDPASIPADQIPAVLTAIAAVQTALAVRLMAMPAQPETAAADDVLLTAVEAATILRRSVKWLYRRASKLPFAHMLDNRSWVFSKRGLEKWIARQRA